MIVLNNALEIERVPFSRLQKSEIPALAESVTRIVEKHEPEVLLIEEVFNLLVAEKPRIDILNSRYGVHPLSLKLKPKREELMLYVSGVKHQLRKVTKTSTDATKDAVTIVKLAVDRNLLYLKKCKSQVEVLQKIQAFLTETETHADLSSALRSLGFMDEVENMELAHADVKSLLDRRRELISLRPKGPIKVVNSGPVFFALTAMFKEIEVAQLKNPSLDYVPLIDELNKLMKEYRNAINRREANNKRKAMQQEGAETEGATSETDASATETSPKEEQSSTEESDNSSVLPTTYVASIEKMDNPRIEEISSNGSNGTGEINLEQLAQKKTVAMPARQMQPSDKNGKA